MALTVLGAQTGKKPVPFREQAGSSHPFTMRVRRLPPDIQDFLLCQTDQEPFVKVCWSPDSLSGACGDLCALPLRCFETAFYLERIRLPSARAGLLFTLRETPVWFAPSFGVKIPHFIFSLFCSPICTCVKMQRSPPQTCALLNTFKMLNL